YWRDAMFKLVRLTIGSCIPCLKARATRQHNYLVTQVQTLLTEGLWQVVGVDLAGPYGRSSTTATDATTEDTNKSHYLLLVHDYVSGYTVARPLRDSKSTTVASVLDCVFLEHGSPAVLLTDHDRTILSGKAVKLTLARHGTRHYILPGYSYHLGFWERAHKDFVEVTRALQASRPVTGPHAPAPTTETSYIADYMVAVRAYNHTPRLWANVTPFQLHFGYSGRLPGLHPETDNAVDWDTLNMRYTSTNIVDFIQKNVPLLTEAREKMESTLGEYLELWRIKQQRHLERYTNENPNDYEPKLFDLIFTTKRSDSSIGNHLQTHWSGPFTIVQLQGSSMVKAIQGILLEGLGGVTAKEDRTTAIVPLSYGASESFSLKNVVHARALQEAVSNYYQKSQRAYLDSDGTLRTMKLTTPSQPDDSRRVSMARDRTALQHAHLPMPAHLRSEDHGGEETTEDLPPLSPRPAHDGLEAEQEQEDPSSSSTAFNSPLAWATPTPGDTNEEQLHVEGTSTPEQMTEEDSPPDDVDITSKLRECLGDSTRPMFGKFTTSCPPSGSLVVSTKAPHIGLAKVTDDVISDSHIQLQALDVVEEDGMITTPEISSIDLYTTPYDSVIYVRPSSSNWTRARGKQLRDLLIK
ncbi:hypothetical protein FOZ63_002157, partial [Perkinsus olseni]